MQTTEKYGCWYEQKSKTRLYPQKMLEGVQPNILQNGDSMRGKFIFFENVEVMSDDKAIAKCLNSHFVNITDSLGLNSSFKSNGADLTLDSRIDIVIAKYKNHPSITAIKVTV